MNNSAIERAFSLGVGFLSKKENLEDPTTKAFVDLIKNMPWLVEVADYGFDPELSKLLLQREALETKIEMRKDELLRN